MADNYSYISNTNGAFVEELYLKYKENPQSVDDGWRKFFEGYEFSQAFPGSQPLVNDKEVAVVKLIHGYRARGHLISNTNPIRARRAHKSDLELEYFGLSEDDLDTEFDAGKDIRIGRATLRRILEHLKQTYCSSIGVEFMFCRNEKLRQWMYETMETIANKPQYDREKLLHILGKINQSVIFENFLQTKYIGKKRFSLEGLEVLIPSLDTAIRQAADLGVEQFTLGMAHRGRLNVLVNIFEKSYEDVFNEFDENLVDEAYRGGGDVKYHLGKSANITTSDGHDVHVSLVPNPSHLEAVGPVVQGIAYAKIQKDHNHDSRKVIPIVIHGDAAMSGQGVNYELANISKIDGYEVGGTVHIILNNQVGFTADYKEGRSSVYCTALAKVTESPVFHVNADDPEAVVHAMETAIKIRQEFEVDVYVDILGYRRYGHNEGDEPRFTQPMLYDAIKNHENVYELFLKRLVANEVISTNEALEDAIQFKSTLQSHLEEAKKSQPLNPISQEESFPGYWRRIDRATPKDFEKSIETGVPKESLKSIVQALTTEPQGIELFSKMKKLLKQRKAMVEEHQQVDWAMGELLAYGSLLIDGTPVRISGQDSQRGTFSHRHAVIKDVQNENIYVPLNNIQEKQAEFTAYNSLLSEYCVMGFEYGYSLASPEALVIWEAQFGDFANGAQIMIDQFISSSEFKWNRMSGLVLLLPHGFEGQGPEHSSARPERFLQLCAQDNMYVVNVTTPANFFHLLRRQIKNKFRKPLIVMSPKSLLRHPKVVSPIEELEQGNFQEVIVDPVKTVSKVKRVVLCTGKIYYELLEKKEAINDISVALVRLEQLYPLPLKQLEELKKQFPRVKDWVWVQEEPQNMGAWGHILLHLREWNLNVISRAASASPATGSSKIHEQEQSEIINKAFTLK